MSIKVVTGVPGSGKTYFVVREVISKNYRFSKTYGEWLPKHSDKKLTIITNVAGLRLPHVSIDNICSEFGYKTHRELFTLNGISPVKEKYGYLIIIVDEAQGFFPKSFRDNPGTSNGEDNKNSVFFFFEKHRHEGIDIYLCAQLYKRLNPDIAELFEYHIHAVRRSFSLRGEFKYRIFLGTQQIDTLKFPFHKSIGAIYQTVQVEEELQGKKVNPWKNYMIWGGLLILALVILIPYFINGFYSMANDGSDKKPVKKFSNSGKPVSSGITEKQAQAARVSRRPAPQAGRSSETKTRALKAALVPTPSFTDPDPQPVSENENLVALRTGGMWFAGKLVAIHVLSNMYTPDTIPFSYHVDTENHYIDVYVPGELVAEMRRPVPFNAAMSSRPMPTYQGMSQGVKSEFSDVRDSAADRFTVDKPDYFERKKTVKTHEGGAGDAQE